MTRVVVLLRGVNVGPSTRLAMADLRAVLADAGAQDVRTYLQSGNAVVTAPVSGLADAVQCGLRQVVGRDVAVLVRTAAQVGRVIGANPFPDKESEPKRLHVAFVDPAPTAAAVEALGLRHGTDELAPGPGAVYLSFAGTSHDSPLQPVLRRLDGVVTARNWSTVTRLHAMATEG